MKIRLTLLITLSTFIFHTSAQTVNLDFVTVGNAGNIPDSLTGMGAVNYSYGISAYDVTVSQYTSFLNATCSTGDTYGLYNSPVMAPFSTYSGISQTLNNGVYSYSVVGNGSLPIFGTTWFDAARFTNWLSNGQGSGSTETGAYALNGATSGIIVASGGAQYRLPTNNEWYKAAYYSPTLNSGNGGYYLYATQSNTAPGNIWTNRTLPNQANYSINGVTTLPLLSDNLTSVGSFTNSASYYGTFDQAGNIYNWTDGVSGQVRGSLGSSYLNDATILASISQTSGWNTPTDSSYLNGFRVYESIPEPGVAGFFILGAGLISFIRRRN